MKTIQTIERCDICKEIAEVQTRDIQVFRTFDGTDGMSSYTEPKISQVKIDVCKACLQRVSVVQDFGVQCVDLKFSKIGNDVKEKDYNKLVFKEKRRVPNILTLMENVSKYMYNKEILNTVDSTYVAKVTSGIAVLSNGNKEFFISHLYTPIVRHGVSVDEIKSMIKYEVVTYEAEYGKLELEAEHIERVNKIMYAMNLLASRVKGDETKEYINRLLDTFTMLFFSTLSRDLVGVTNDSITLKHGQNDEVTFRPMLNEEQLKDIALLVEKMSKARVKLTDKM